MIEEVMMDDPREDIVAEAKSSADAEIAVDLVDDETESISRHFNNSSKSNELQVPSQNPYDSGLNFTISKNNNFGLKLNNSSLHKIQEIQSDQNSPHKSEVGSSSSS